MEKADGERSRADGSRMEKADGERSRAADARSDGAGGERSRAADARSDGAGGARSHADGGRMEKAAPGGEVARTKAPAALENVAGSTTTEGLPVAPSLGPSLAAEELGAQPSLFGARALRVCGLAVLVAAAAGVVARVLVSLIDFFTNLAFYGRLSLAPASPADNHLGAAVLVVPIVGGLVVGVMARYGSPAIRGHGIPEAMERVLEHESRIPARMTFLKPLSAAIAIGTGGPFGAEGPIIATGGALGSLVGQLGHMSPKERRALLAAGAAAGMAATFGSPVSAVLLAIELLLFELSPRSLVPVALAAATATAVRIALVGAAPVFPMPLIVAPSSAALATYVLIGAVVGVASVYVTRAVYAIEEAFEKLPVHWMWWPAIGALAVGAVGYFQPHALGVGYDNIERIVDGQLAARALFFLCAMKLVAWSISLGSGTSGGTLAPLFTIGGGLGALLGMGAAALAPQLGVDPRVAGLVGMAAMFAGASRALLASVVFAFETTRQPMGLLPLLGGCASAYLISCVLMRHSIMTRKIAERGVRVPTELASDVLDRENVGEYASRDVVTLRADQTLAAAREWLASKAAGSTHQGFPVVDASGAVLGVLTRRDLTEAAATESARGGAARTDAAKDESVRSEAARSKAALPDAARSKAAEAIVLADLIRRAPILAFEDTSLREAALTMAREDIGRLPVVVRGTKGPVVGMLTRSDVLRAQLRNLEEERVQSAVLLRGREREAPATT
jgi:H+/Cl- antiporter ClcA